MDLYIGKRVLVVKLVFVLPWLIVAGTGRDCPRRCYSDEGAASTPSSIFFPPDLFSTSSSQFLIHLPPGCSGTTDGVAGEMGSKTPGAAYVNQNLREMVLHQDGKLKDAAFVLHFGDLAYAWSTGYTWELWQTEQRALAETRPYMVSVGNHEYDHGSDDGGKDPSHAPGAAGYHPSWGNLGNDSEGECGVPVFHRFPNPPPNGNGIFWYSFKY